MPPGEAFLHGAHAVLALARARLELSQPAAALAVAAPLAEDAKRGGWRAAAAEATLVRAVAELALGEHAAARRGAERALEEAEDAEMPSLAWQAHGVLAELAGRAADAGAAEGHLARARAIVGDLARTLAERRDRDRFRRFAAARLQRLSRASRR
jgi:hypothetical protein